ncbi:MarR family transcriptional regulator [Roseomonas sp. OT10]|uniref:MarR family winged helix-turn-helix transcriptional regulator n=1 Tax=Roseomonas cutis TaxID=2897332 RepID=UPI001E36F684|nr:MarR family transcriptional regulator [Roseomonas sp. OT10]UFN49477.1 MarR family transcriptional regulator [Roseomonas sp. OT10]
MSRTTRTLYLLRQAQLASHACLERALGELGLTPTQYTVLSLSDRPAPGLSSAELARRAGVTAQAMGEVITALEQKRLIERREAPENRRILRIALTRGGRSLLARCDAAVTEAETRFLSVLAKPELEALRAALIRLRAAREAGPAG